MATEKVLANSALSYDSALDIFSTPACNLGIQDVKYIEYKPVNSFSSESSIRFVIPNTGSQYLFLPETKLKVKLRVLKHDGTVLPAMPAAPEEGVERNAADALNANWASVSTSNFLLHSLFDMVEIKLGDTIVTRNDSGYSYRAMINALLDTSAAVKQSLLQSALFFIDTPGAMDSLSIDPIAGENRGLVARANYIAESRPVELMGALDVDILKTPKYLLNGIPLTMTLFSTSTAFRLMSGNELPGGYAVEIMDISLIMAHVTAAANVLIAHQKILQSNTVARYFFVQEELRKATIGQGNTSFFSENFFNSTVPDRLVLALCTSEQLGGNIRRNPYHFRSANLSYISISINGVPCPQGLIKTDFNNPAANVQPFTDLYTTSARVAGADKHFGNLLTRDHFNNGYSLFSVDLNPATRRGQFFPTKKEASVRLELRFSQPLATTMVLLCMAFSGNYFEIDYARNVYLGR